MSDEQETKIIHRRVARLQARITGFTAGLILGLSLFITTAWLLIKGGPHVGQHLQLLRQYFPGYSVTWVGCFIGFGYGMIVGWIMGWSVAWIYNRLLDLKKS